MSGSQQFTYRGPLAFSLSAASLFPRYKTCVPRGGTIGRSSWGRKSPLGLLPRCCRPPVAAEPITLKLNSPAPPLSYVNREVLTPWAEAVTADSDGTLKIQTFYGGTLGTFANTYDRVADQVVDIGFILTAFAAGKIKQQDVAALPFEAENAILASTALWTIYEKGVTAGARRRQAARPVDVPQRRVPLARADQHARRFQGQEAHRLQRDRREDRHGARCDPDQLPPRRGLYGDPARHHRRRADAVHRHGDLQGSRGDASIISTPRSAATRRCCS